MALVVVEFGKRVESADVNQIIGLLKGTTDYGDAVLLTDYNNASNWSLKIQNQDTTNSRALAIMNAEGTSEFVVVRRTSSNDVMTIGAPDGSQPSTSQFGNYKTHSSGSGYVLTDSVLTETATDSDVSAVRGVVSHTSGDSAIIGGEFHAVVSTGAGGGHGMWGIQASAQSADGAVGSHLGTVGIVISSSNSDWGLGANVAQDTGLLIGGANGWNNGIVYLDTDGATELFKVAGTTGAITSGTIQPRADNTYSVGTSASVAYAVMYSRVFAAGTAGTAAAPPFTNGNAGETDNGMFFPATNAVGFSTSGTEQIRITATTGILDFRNSQAFAVAGGAAATLGGITNGPAAAAQSHWLQVKDGGTTRFAALWT